MAQQEGQRSGGASAGGYGVQEVADLLDTTPARVRGWVRAGLLSPSRGPRGALRFSFRDLAFLRQLKDLEAGRVAPRRVRRAIRRLRDAGEVDLAALGLDARRGEVVMREGDTLFSPESGQGVFDFAPRAAPGGAPVIDLGERRRAARDEGQDDARSAEEWYRLGQALESVDPEQAADAYRRALALDAKHADAAINLGCLHHERGRLALAERAYRAAVEARPDATAWFDLAVVLEDQERTAEARRAYEAALAADPACAEAHFNLANLCDRSGDAAGALRHLTAYRKLS